jgi:hypothetical protein
MKVVDQGGKAEQKNALFCIHHHNSTHFFSPCSKKSSPSLICMIRVWVPPPPPTPQILFQMFDFYFHSWADEVFSTYLKIEFWGLKLSSSRRAQTGVECVFRQWLQTNKKPLAWQCRQKCVESEIWM